MTIDEAIKNREDCLKYLENIGRRANPECVEAVRWSVKALKTMRDAHIDRDAWKKCCKKCKYEDDNEGIPIYYTSDWDNGIGFERDNAIFCPKCGRPLTDEAWDELEKRLRG